MGLYGRSGLEVGTPFPVSLGAGQLAPACLRRALAAQSAPAGTPALAAHEGWEPQS